jgi:hypothetical protein
VLLCIFGAGASFDSVDVRAVHEVSSIPDYRPPLARDLFTDRPIFNTALVAFPQFGGRILGIRRSARDQRDFDVERELQAIREEAAEYPPARSELAAVQFYLQRVLGECGTMWHDRAAGHTNYRELLGRIDRWRARSGRTFC